MPYALATGFILTKPFSIVLLMSILLSLNNLTISLTENDELSYFFTNSANL